MATYHQHHYHQAIQLRQGQDRMENFAGFGARKFAESQAREQELRDQWEQYEQERLRYEEEQAWYHSQLQQQQHQWQDTHPNRGAEHDYDVADYRDSQRQAYSAGPVQEDNYPEWSSRTESYHQQPDYVNGLGDGYHTDSHPHSQTYGDYPEPDYYDAAHQHTEEDHRSNSHDMLASQYDATGTNEYAEELLDSREHAAYQENTSGYEGHSLALDGFSSETRHYGEGYGHDGHVESDGEYRGEGTDPDGNDTRPQFQDYSEPTYQQDRFSVNHDESDPNGTWPEHPYHQQLGVSRSDTLASGTSSVHLAYDAPVRDYRDTDYQHSDEWNTYTRQSEPRADQSRLDGVEQDHGTSYDSDVPSTPRPKTEIPLPSRKTVYGDDYEEGDQSLVDSRYTQYSENLARGEVDDHHQSLGVSTASTRRRPRQASASALARRSVARDTIYIPDPKARCADCGMDINFEELANHQCTSRSLSAMSSSLHSSVTPTEGVASRVDESPALDEDRSSPFFDKYLEVAEGKVTGAFATSMTRSASADSQSQGEPEPRPAVQRSHSGPDFATLSEVEERRKRIEEQRQAKRAGRSSPSSNESSSRRRRIAHDKSESSSSLSSAQDSLLSSSTMGSPHTPGSTYDEDSLGPDDKHSETLFTALAPIAGALDKVARDPVVTDFDADNNDQHVVGIDQKEAGSMAKNFGGTSANKSPRRGLRVPLQNAAKESDDVKIQLVANLMKDLSTSSKPHGRPREPDIALAEDGLATPGRSPPRTRQDANPPPLASGKSKRDDKIRRAARKCCVCECSLSSSRTPFVEQDGKLLCTKDYAKLYLPKCGKCRSSVEKNAVKSSDGALKGVFHRACFSCFDCDATFEDGSFYVYENAPYCAEHYHERNGSQCAMCGEGIEGPCRQTETGERYHPYCLRCEFEAPGEFCNEMLTEFWIVQNHRLCERHADRVGLKLQKEGHGIKKERRRTMLRNVG